MTDDICIGIDLGTTYSCVAVWINNKVEIIANNIGERTTPSWVAFTDAERLIGMAAKTQASYNPENTVYDSKRLIGRPYDDSAVQTYVKHWPFKVTCGELNKPLINITYKGENKLFTAEEISAMILTEMKTTAETYLGKPVKRAVITVPAYFNDAQRRATVDAGIIAGLKVERIINEPTAAAIAYGLDKTNEGEKTVLVFDLGGGTFDVSLLTIDHGLFEVKATCGNSYLGGQDFDNKLVTWCLKEFKMKNKNIDVDDMVKNAKVLGKLKSACEKAKKTLSVAMTTMIEVDSLYNGIDFRISLSRAKFEALCIDDFKKCLEPVEQVLKDAKMSKKEVTDIVLVGGSTRIPKVKDILKEYFDGKEPKQDINPDEAVAYGAAVQGAVLSKVKNDQINQLVLIDVTPLSLGIETAGGIMTKIIPRNSTVPCSKEQTFSTYSDNQPGVTVKVFEGEREFTTHNNILGSFELTDLPKMSRGIPKIKVKFEIDRNGILNVTAVEDSTGKSNKIVIKNDKTRFNDEQLKKMIDDALNFAEEDRVRKATFDAKNDLENYIYNTRNHMEGVEFKNKLSGENFKIIADTIYDVCQWLECSNEYTIDDFKAKKIELDNVVGPILMNKNVDNKM